MYELFEGVNEFHYNIIRFLTNAKTASLWRKTHTYIFGFILAVFQ